jgi:hypothetical protein
VKYLESYFIFRKKISFTCDKFIYEGFLLPRKKRNNKVDDILQKNTFRKLYHAWNGSNIIEIDYLIFGDNNEHPLSGSFVRWKEDNQNGFIICYLPKYKSNYFLLIKVENIIKDLLEVINGRMTILWAYVQDYEDNILFKFVLQEIDFQEGDGMPQDIWLDNFNYIKDGMKKKSDKYKTYVSNSKIQRTNRLYDVEFNEFLDTDKENGLIRIEINPKL